jgi:hypothetical protein
MKNQIDYASYIFDRSNILFLIKVLTAIIVVLVAYFVVSFVLKKIDDGGSLNERVAMIYLKGMVGNAESFYATSLEYEKKNRYAKAIVEMKYAIGLLESQPNNANKLECYRRRLAYLQQERLFYEGF